MKSETGYDTFTRTRITWLTLTGAALLWVAACLWAFSAVEFGAVSDTPVGDRQAVQSPSRAPSRTPSRAQTRLAQIDAEEKVRLDAQAAAAMLREQATEAEAARLALEAEEQTRLEAQGKAAERRRLAAEKEAEMAALKATALAEQRAKDAAEAEELAQQAARAIAAEIARAAEEARLASEAKAAEKTRLAAVARAAEEVKLAAVARTAEEARLAAVARAAEQERVKEVANARQPDALTSQSKGVDEQARKAAAAEASRIAALARQQRSYNSARGQKLGVLGGLSSRLRFAPGSATVSRQTERVLDDIFNPLYLYSEASILVSVATNEYDGTRNDGLLSRDRGRAIASYLINRGLEKERFRIHIESGEKLSAGTHRVRVSAEEVRQ